MTDEPLIYTCLPRPSNDNVNATAETAPGLASANPTDPETRGDVLAHGFWKRGCPCIFDIRVTDVDCPSARGQEPAAILARHENEKKKKHLQPCLDRRRHFTPLVFSADGLRGTEADAAIKRLATLLAKKWSRTYSQVCGFVRSRLSIALARSTSLCLRGTRESDSHPRHYSWEAGGAGLGLYR